jgi:hypothetical protein
MDTIASATAGYTTFGFGYGRAPLMFHSAAGSILEYLEEELQLEERPSFLATVYRTAKPFPHLILHNLFPAERLDGLVREIASLPEEEWVIHDEEHISKANLRSAVDLGENGKRHVSLLHSAEFLYLISEITGIWGLLPDPYLAGSGYHVFSSGGRFDLHADRNFDHNTGLTRRIAMITYLNRDWRNEYGGQLELWATDASHCEQVVEPDFNTTILFEVGEHNFHGVRPVQPPTGVFRRSFATYFHTVGNAEGITATPHNSIYAPSIYQHGHIFRRLALDYVIPPGIVRSLRQIKRKM